MTDLIDIMMGIDSSPIKTAKQELAELGNSFNSAQKSASTFEQAFARAAAQSARDAKFMSDRVRLNQELVNANLRVSNSYKSAQESASAFTTIFANQDRQAKEFTATLNRLSGVTGALATESGAGYSAMDAELERLSLKYDKAYAASKLFEAQQRELNFAMLNGAGNAETLKLEMDKLQAEYAAFQGGTTQLGNRFNMLTQATEQSRKGVNRWGLLVQQTGYQAGDFLVQIQSGTNAFVAFGQQATQLVGILPMFATELGVSAAALGGITLGLSLAIPLLTAFGAYMTRTNKGAKEGSKDIDTYSQAINSLTQEIKANQEAFLKLKFDTTDSGVASAKQQIEDFQKSIKDTQKVIDSLQPGLGLPGAESVYLRSLFTQSDLDKAVEKRDNLQKQLDILLSQVEAQRMLNGEGSSALAIQRNIVENKQKEFQASRDVAKAVELSVTAVKTLASTEPGSTWLSGAISKADTLATKLWDAAHAAAAASFTGGGPGQGGLQGPAGMGAPITEADIRQRSFNVPNPLDGNKGSGGGGGAGNSAVQALVDSLMSQQEVIDKWYKESQDALQSASDQELAIIGGRHEAELRLEEEHQKKLAAIKDMGQKTSLSITLGAGEQILSALGEHNAKAAKMAKVFGAAQALADTYAGAAAALKLPFPANLAAASSIIAAGLGFVNAIRSGGTASVNRGGIGSVGTSASAQQATPQQVLIQGMKPTDIFTGEQLSTLFDSLYKENRNRGMVFMVQR